MTKITYSFEDIYVGDHITYLMNPYTGSVDTEENWTLDGWEDADLIEVVFINGEWVEAD